MDKFWLKSYPPGVPAEIDVNQYKSLVHLLDESFSKFADRKAYVCMDKYMTYRELDEMSRKVGLVAKPWFEARCACRHHDAKRIAYPVALAAVLRAGYGGECQSSYTPRELEHQLKDSGAEAIFILENFATT